MPAPPDFFARFVHAVHRRHILATLGEHAGTGLVVGVGATIPLLVAFAFLHRPPTELVLLFLLLGAACGLAVGWRKRPSPLQSALEADRQLRWSDLLSTAWATRDQTAPWANAVRTAADAKCRAARPASVVLFRWGARAWGGLGLSVSFVMVAAMLIQPATTTPSGAAEGNAFARSDQQTPPVTSRVGESAKSTFRPLHPSPTADSGDEVERPGEQTVAESQARGGATGEAKRAGEGGQTGSGGGFAESKVRGSSLELPTGGGSEKSSSNVGTAPTASGGRGASVVMGGIAGQPGGSVTTGDGRATENRGTVGDARSAGPDAQSESQPQYAPYRELIRDYFDRR